MLADDLPIPLLHVGRSRDVIVGVVVRHRGLITHHERLEPTFSSGKRQCISSCTTEWTVSARSRASISVDGSTPKVLYFVRSWFHRDRHEDAYCRILIESAS